MYLSWYEDNSRVAKQHREVLLDVLNHAQTGEETKESGFYRRTSLKPVQGNARVYILYRGSQQVTTSQ